MKMSQMFFNTLRDTKEDDSKSNYFLTKAGMIRKNSAGVYSFMPMGHRVMQNIENIIREEMNSEGANELVMPCLITEEVYEKAGRLEVFGDSVLRVKDRADKRYILGPTHEEIFTEAVRDNIKSYKNLPINLYQFQTKFRDEARPRYGLLRTKEFVMKDAYSFDKDYENLEISYKKMYDAYHRIFKRLGLNYVVVKADTGAMGGLLSEEFMALADIGEDKLVICDKCGFSSNREVAECNTQVLDIKEKFMELEELNTPKACKVNNIVRDYGVKSANIAKTLIYKSDAEHVIVMVRGDREVNEVKVQKFLGSKVLELATTEDVRRLSGADVGFAGPIGMKLRIVADSEIKNMVNFLVGANKTDYHYKNVNVQRDFIVDNFADIRNITEEDECPVCGGKISFKNGIEVGNTFKLGTKYSEALNCVFVNEENKEKPMIMGCYGIGLARCMATIVEQSNDDNGIIWPMEVAPYKVTLIPINSEDEEQMKIVEKMCSELGNEKIEVVIDDRKERPGVKFKDADLIGIPVRVTIGKKASENIVEFKLRKGGEMKEISVEEAIAEIKKVCR
ncbi:MAG TPA: proline--tRNA ligase [Clostridiales bacterium]|nr:MAG: proline--tRNA ligase [Clostridiales bacterium GWD2_32_59]HAN10776.1 proline--tRNA ligase [Clostridiales bacterium]